MPAGLPTDWLTSPPPGFGAREIPYEKMLLRWTAALKEKRDKLEGCPPKIQGYRAKGIVQDGDPYVVAINACRLSSLAQEKGPSGLALAVEAVFPVGPWAFPILEKDGRLGEPFRSVRPFIKKENHAEVRVDNFLDAAYAGVSALLGCSTCYAPDGGLELVVVHNPLAHNRLPVGFLGTTTEYLAEQTSAGCELRPIRPA
jgi:hypothetical protein